MKLKKYKKIINQLQIIKKETKDIQANLDKKTNKVINKRKSKILENKGSEIIKYQPKTRFSLLNFCHIFWWQ